MNKRIVIDEATALQVASLAQSRVHKVTKPQGDQSIVLDLSDQSVKLDFSAIADEKMTFMQAGTRLVILFDNMSRVTADPFFDFSGKAISNLNVELGGGRAVNGEQFAQLFPITDDQSGQRTSGNIPASGANFRDVSIDSLPGGPSPLALLHGEQLKNAATDVDRSSVGHFNALTPTPVVTIPSPGGPATMVFEAGLGVRNGEPAGTHAGQPSFPTTTRAGTISFTSADGVQSVSLGGHTLSGTSQTFPDGSTGSLTASFTFNAATGKGTISYSYTLLDNTLGVPSASFAVLVTDADGHSNPPASLVITIVDDVPVARPDTDAITPSQTTPETGNVLTGAGTKSGIADAQGADGGLTVVGVAGGNGPGGAAPGTVGVAIAGAHGTLTLNADGSYSYVHTVGGGTDVFTYTVKDSDGSLAHATLTILLGNSAPNNFVIPPPGLVETQVFEAGLLAARGPGESAGSHAGETSFPTTTQNGVITFISSDGVSKVELGGLVLHVGDAPQSFTDATGRLTASVAFDAATGKGTINYSYTLLDNTLGTPSANFAVAVTDTDGDRTPGGNLVINIADDTPLAIADTDAVVAGQTTAETGNVLTGAGTTSGAVDVQGADGVLHVVSVAAGGGATVPVDPSTGATIVGAFGTLTLHADGSYSYARTMGVPGGANSDVFTYTTKDADGSQSTTTLTIAVADSSPGGISIPAPGGASTQVFEAGLLAARGPGESAGSHAGETSFPTTTQNGVITFTSPDGVSKVELGGLVLHIGDAPLSFIDATGRLTASVAYDAATGQGTISYSYTLLDNTLGTPSVNFPVAVTDADGDRTPGGNLVINIVDDTPLAIADTDAVAAGQTTAETGNVLTGASTTSGAVDVLGADGAAAGGAVVGVVLGMGATPVSGGVGTAIAGAFGTLTLNADGSYSYAHAGVAGGGADTFTYTIRDADGSQSTTTLTIAVADSSPGGISIPAPGGASTQVFEAGLLAARGPGESAGSHAGETSFPTTSQNGTITFTSAFEAGLLAARGPGESAGSHAGDAAFPTTTQNGTITFTSANRSDSKKLHFGCPERIMVPPHFRKDLESDSS
jgi:VCBS repeat-containing protein